MKPTQKRALLLIHGGAVQVMPRRRRFGALWAAVCATAAVAVLAVILWGVLTLPAALAQ